MATNKKSENIVIIFAKKPEVGKVKTRIAKETSFKFAYQFARFCFLDLINKVSKSDYYDLAIATDTTADLLWFQNNFSLDGFVIDEDRLKIKNLSRSEKFDKIFRLVLGGNDYDYKKLLLIPMDIPFISEEDLISAFVRLNKKRFVFGPEVNGGVYLMGTRFPYDNDIFQGVSWSTSYSFNDLLNRTGKKDTFILKIKNDLNLPEDILSLQKNISYNCPLLYSFLKSNGYYLPQENQFIDFDNLSICLPVVANIVEREQNGELKILIQNRYKPTIDPNNLNKIEIPSGLIEKYELAQRAAVRETLEETGILSKIYPQQNFLERVSVNKVDNLVAYRPFYCHQQVRGGRSYLILSFISKYIKGEPKERFRESRNPRWISVSSLKTKLDNEPENFFPVTFSVLKQYFKFKEYEKYKK